MDFHSFIPIREATKRSGIAEEFYRIAMADAVRMKPGQFYGRLANGRDRERAQRPNYNVWPSIVPMPTTARTWPWCGRGGAEKCLGWCQDWEV